MRASALVLLMMCACSHVQYGGNVNGASVDVNTANVLGAVLLGGMLSAAAVEDFREPSWTLQRAAMSPDRPVVEQDCTKPIELTGNLRCK